MRSCLVFLCLFFLAEVDGQDSVYQYHNAILHIENDPDVYNLVSSAFHDRLREQPAPISYCVADSLTFIDINFALEGEFDPIYGIDSLAFNSVEGFKKLYDFENIAFFHAVPKPPAENRPLHVFLSKRIGDCIIVEITEDPWYPASQKIRFGTSLIVLLLIDKDGSVKENLRLALVHNN